jgi:hypothetical protein
MPISSKSSRVSSPNRKIQDVPELPTITGVSENATSATALDVAVTPSQFGGRPELYRATSTPGNIEGISFGSSPITVNGLTPGTNYNFTVRAETNLGANRGATALSAAANTPTGALVPIATALGANTSGAEVLTFANIPQFYKDLVLVMSLQPNITVNLALDAFAGGAVSNRSVTRLTSNGSAVSSLRGTSATEISLAGSLPSTQPTTVLVEFIDYAASNKFKTVLCKYASDRNGSGEIILSVGAVAQLQPITGFAITTQILNGFWSTNSRFTLYGIKGE